MHVVSMSRVCCTITMIIAAFRSWIEARQQAAEEELEMPVVLEEFGCKLDKRWVLSLHIVCTALFALCYS